MTASRQRVFPPRRQHTGRDTAIARLEDLTKGALVTGVVADKAVTVVDVTWHGSEVLTLTYRAAGGAVAERLVHREDEARLAIVGRRLEGPATAPRLVDDRIATRSSFVAHLGRVIPKSLEELDDAQTPLPELFAAAIEAGVNAMDRFLEIRDGHGTLTPDTARSLATGVLWEVGILWATRVPLAPAQFRAFIEGMLPTVPLPEAFGQTDFAISEAVRRLLRGHRAEAGDAELLRRILPRLVEFTIEVRLSSWRTRPWGALWAGRDDVIEEARAITEIGYGAGGGYGGGYGAVTVRADGSASREDAQFGDPTSRDVSEFDPLAFEDLARAIVFLGYDSLEEHYHNPNVLDAGGSSIRVVRDGRQEEVSEYGGAGPEAMHRIVGLIGQATADLAWRPDPDLPVTPTRGAAGAARPIPVRGPLPEER